MKFYCAVDDRDFLSVNNEADIDGDIAVGAITQIPGCLLFLSRESAIELAEHILRVYDV